MERPTDNELNSIGTSLHKQLTSQDRYRICVAIDNNGEVWKGVKVNPIRHDRPIHVYCPYTGDTLQGFNAKQAVHMAFGETKQATH